MHSSAAYMTGANDAAEEFGLRVASDGYRRGLPTGDPNHPVERLAAMLKELPAPSGVPTMSKEKKLERHVRWSKAFSPYATTATSYDFSGIGRDGAAL